MRLVTVDEIKTMPAQLKSRIVELLQTGSRAWPFEQYEAQLLSGDLQLWLFARKRHLMAAMLTSLAPEPDGLWGIVRWISGHSRWQWQHLINAVHPWFRERGCVGSRCTARKGWEREMPDWKKTAVVLEYRYE